MPFNKSSMVSSGNALSQEIKERKENSTGSGVHRGFFCVVPAILT